jgi:hypothetical protein
MSTSLTEFKAFVLDQLLDLLWRLWSALGVAGSSASEKHRVIDPEPLLLLSLTICRYDARLFDEILDWLLGNGAFLNVQRLKNLENQFDFQGKAQLSAISEFMGKKSNYALKWKRLSATHFIEKLEPLFFTKEGWPLPLSDDAAPEFRAHGLLRGRIKLRGYSQLFPSQGMPSLLLRLRALLGVNARCELLCLLGAMNEIHPSDIARQTGYFPRTVQKALVEMTYSGVVRVRSTNREKRYWLQPGVFDSLLRPEGEPTPWRNWSPLFRALEILWLGLIDPKWQDLDLLLLASELRRLVRKMKPFLGEAGWEQYLRDDKAFIGEEYAEVFFQDMEEMLKRINHPWESNI